MPNKIIRDILGLRKTEGDVGVEIEMEARRPPPNGIKWWRSEPDGSLRGYAIEYVMSEPSHIGDVEKKLTYLMEKVEESNCAPKYSERAGVHVHVNVQELTTKQVLTMAMVYYCLENPLVKYCGDNREGNHFCLRLKDADFVVNLLEHTMVEKNLRYLHNEDIRYASLNFCSLFNYGSLEFRAMETQPDFSKILEWCQMLVAIRDYAVALGSSDQIPFDISAYSPSGWARRILGDKLFGLINHPEFDQDVMRSMRPIQHLLYMKEG